MDRVRPRVVPHQHLGVRRRREPVSGKQQTQRRNQYTLIFEPRSVNQEGWKRCHILGLRCIIHSSLRKPEWGGDLLTLRPSSDGRRTRTSRRAATCSAASAPAAPGHQTGGTNHMSWFQVMMNRQEMMNSTARPYSENSNCGSRMRILGESANDAPHSCPPRRTAPTA